MKIVLVASLALIISVGAVSCKSHGTCPAYGNATIKKSSEKNVQFQVNQTDKSSVIGRN
jgi:hypothetical protein